MYHLLGSGACSTPPKPASSLYAFAGFGKSLVFSCLDFLEDLRLAGGIGAAAQLSIGLRQAVVVLGALWIVLDRGFLLWQCLSRFAVAPRHLDVYITHRQPLGC